MNEDERHYLRRQIPAASDDVFYDFFSISDKFCDVQRFNSVLLHNPRTTNRKKSFHRKHFSNMLTDCGFVLVGMMIAVLI